MLVHKQHPYTGTSLSLRSSHDFFWLPTKTSIKIQVNFNLRYTLGIAVGDTMLVQKFGYKKLDGKSLFHMDLGVVINIDYDINSLILCQSITAKSVNIRVHRKSMLSDSDFNNTPDDKFESCQTLKRRRGERMHQNF